MDRAISVFRSDEERRLWREVVVAVLGGPDSEIATDVADGVVEEYRERDEVQSDIEREREWDEARELRERLGKLRDDSNPVLARIPCDGSWDAAFDDPEIWRESLKAAFAEERERSEKVEMVADVSVEDLARLLEEHTASSERKDTRRAEANRDSARSYADALERSLRERPEVELSLLETGERDDG